VLYKPNYHDDTAYNDGTLSNRWTVRTDTELTDTIRLVAVRDGKRLIGEVKILDMNII